jgi:transcription initiation factor TFIIB
MKQTTSFHERTTVHAVDKETLDLLVRISHELKLTTTVSRRALSIISGAKNAQLRRRVPHGVLAGAALYVACRENNTPLTLRDFADASGSHPRDIGRCYLQILESMNISRPGMNGNGYVSRLLLKHPVSEDAMHLSQEIIHTMSDKGLGGRNPMTLAAASLYIACCSMGENVTQAEVAEAAGVGEESVRECCKEIRTLGGLCLK